PPITPGTSWIASRAGRRRTAPWPWAIVRRRRRCWPRLLCYGAATWPGTASRSASPTTRKPIDFCRTGIGNLGSSCDGRRVTSKHGAIMTSFADQVALITGAGSGLGRELALRLAKEGAAVAAIDLKPEPLEALTADLPGRRVAWAVADVTDRCAL